MSIAAKSLAPKNLQSENQNNIRVMIVDDSVVVRGLVSRWVEEEEGIQPVGKFANGLKAVEGVAAANPDIVILDIEMPVMDGLEALPKIIKAAPHAKVIMASTLTQRNAEISLNALSLGAADYIPKPVSNSGVTTSKAFRRDLIEKIRVLSASSVKRRRSSGAQARTSTAVKQAVSSPDIKSNNQTATIATTDTDYKIRPFSNVRPRALVIGSSTGGPPALMKVLEECAGLAKYLPILITQHMPATFTGIFATHIQRATGIQTNEGVDGESIQAGKIYVAPGGKHMTIERQGSKPIIRLTDGPDVNFCKPAVDPLFKSAAKVYGSAALAVVFTGMGVDGAAGSVTIADAGGSVIAQDEATSVVWGMPGATAKAGACSAILPLNNMSQQISKLIQGKI